MRDFRFFFIINAKSPRAFSSESGLKAQPVTTHQYLGTRDRLRFVARSDTDVGDRNDTCSRRTHTLYILDVDTNEEINQTERSSVVNPYQLYVCQPITTRAIQNRWF